MIRKLVVILLSGTICLMLGMNLVVAQEKVLEGGLKVYTTLKDYEASTGKKIEKFSESLMLRVKVAAGELPPIEERLPEEPMVIDPLEEIGQYGGTMVGYSRDARGWGTLVDIFESDFLVLKDDSGSPSIFNVAKGYKFSEDYKSVTIYLRKGIKWSDGVPFTADDIMFGYEDIIMNEKLALQMGQSMQHQYYSPTDEPARLEKIDDYTVCFHFPEPYPVFKYHLSGECGRAYKIIFPKHYLAKWHIKYNPKADELAKEKGLDHWYELYPTMSTIVAGPQHTTVNHPTLGAYVLKEKGSGYMIAERNPYYWKIDTEGNQLPYIDKLMVIQNLDSEIATAKILAGDFDFGDGTVDDLSLLKENEEKGNYRVLMWEMQWGGGVSLQLNLTYKKDLVLRKIFRDVRFRRALSLAINREEYNEVIFRGLGDPCQGTIYRKASYYEEEFARSYAEYNPARANALLDEMSLNERDKEGYRLRKDGKRLSILIEYIGSASGSAGMELIKEYWEAVGVEVALKPEAAQLTFERFPSNEVQVGGGGNGYICMSDVAVILGCPWLSPTGWPGYNTQWPLWLKWALTGGKEGEEPIEEVKKNMERVRRMQTTTDDEERARLAKELLRSHAENLWQIGTVCYSPLIKVARKNLGNVPEKTTQKMGTYWFTQTWFFKEAEEQNK